MLLQSCNGEQNVCLLLAVFLQDSTSTMLAGNPTPRILDCVTRNLSLFAALNTY